LPQASAWSARRQTAGRAAGGIIVGKRELIAQLQQHPLKRALRADKMTLAALEATLRLYLHPEKLADRLPTLRLLTRDAASIRAQAELLLPRLRRTTPILTFALSPASRRLAAVRCRWTGCRAKRSRSRRVTGAAATLRRCRRAGVACTPVIGRIYDGRMWLDLRCLEDEERFLEMLLK
jgi:L-seryl-tRNA(Ser) seleniumtransferase